jgi:hypothetical protein
MIVVSWHDRLLLSILTAGVWLLVKVNYPADSLVSEAISVYVLVACAVYAVGALVSIWAYRQDKS